MASTNQENGGFFTKMKGLWENVVCCIVDGARNVKKLGEEDPRRIIHSAKVGLAIALVSLIYYCDPTYKGFGVSAMWAVMTVVVIFEFSVGATLGRGINRGIATLLGGALGVGGHRIASLCGIEILEPILLGINVFFFAAVVTFMRFFPKLKARYDYGLLIFNLTFCLISVSGYRDDEVLDMAVTRLTTIVIGGTAAVLTCVVIFPVWAGTDLHNMVADNIEKLGTFLEGFGEEFFKKSGERNLKDVKEQLEKYKSVLNSKSSEDSLVNSARWEPRHGRFRYRHPWAQYQKVAALTRECAYRLDSLNGYLKAELQTSEEIRAKFEGSCRKMSKECSTALKKLALSIKSMTCCGLGPDLHILNAKSAADSLKLLLKTNSWQGDILEIIPMATVASLLIEVVSYTVKIAESVQELATQAKFKTLDEESNQEQIEKFKKIASSIESHNVSIPAE